MLTKIMKRDGEVVPYDSRKIVNAVLAAGIEAKDITTIGQAQEVVEFVEELLAGNEFMADGEDEVTSVEEVQDLVEEALITLGYKASAKEYILYRYKRAEVRNMDKALDLVDAYMEQEDWRIKENANQSMSVQGLNNYVTGGVMSNYWLKRLYPGRIAKAHQEGDLHLHDLSIVAAYCSGWDLQDLLLRGFGGVPDKTVSGPAKHLDTALGQIWNFMYTLQAECAGAQAFSNFDTLLAPFIRHDKLSYDQVKQAMQMFVFNMNVSTRVGFSAPFTNITMDVTPSINLKDSPVIIGGEYQDTTYGDYQEEMDMLNRAYCEVMTAGDFDGKIFPFPIPTYNLTRDLDWDHPRMEPIWKMTGRYGIPNWSNFINSDLKPEDTRSMCCRLSLDMQALRKRIGGTFASAPLTGSIGVVTINLPRIGLTSQTEEEYFARLREVFDLAALSLSIKRDVVEKNTEKGLYPYCRHYLSSVKAHSGVYWSNHFETIGVVGMNESMLNFMGKPINDPEAREFALKVQSTLADWVETLSANTKKAINLEATPAEGVCHRLARLDRKKFPNCAVQGSGDKVFYTNSTHLPVGYTEDMFEALDHQEEFQTKYTGGTTFHGFIGEEIKDPTTVKSLVRKIAEKYRIPYFTITPTFSVCDDHGYLAGEHFTCPKCEKPAQVFSRIVGYYRPVSCWNAGKQEEFKERKEYQVED